MWHDRAPTRLGVTIATAWYAGVVAVFFSSAKNYGPLAIVIGMGSHIGGMLLSGIVYKTIESSDIRFHPLLKSFRRP